MIQFNLEKKWFDKIKSGEKKIEYREFKPYWIKRFEKIWGTIFWTAPIYFISLRLKSSPDKTYRAVVKYSYFPSKEIREEHELHNCMHVAWRIRGDLLEVCC